MVIIDGAGTKMRFSSTECSTDIDRLDHDNPRVRDAAPV